MKCQRMLTLKFSVPFTSRLWNFRTLTKASCPRFAERKSVVRIRCQDYKRALEKCPKPNFVKRCRSKLFPDNVPRPKCNWSSADDYRRAYEATKIRSRKLTELAEANSRLIVQEMRSVIYKSRCDENLRTKNVLKAVEPHVLELSNLDPVCAMKKKREVLTLNDRTYQELTTRDCETELGLRSIECDLEKLMCEAKCEAAASLALIRSCRKSQSPESLMHCVEHSSREAAKMLDEIFDDFEIRITSIKNAKDEILKEDKKFFSEVLIKYEKNMSELLSEIVNCIHGRRSR